MKKIRALSGVPSQAQGQTMYAPTKKRNSLTAGLYKMFMKERKQADKTGKDPTFEVLPRYNAEIFLLSGCMKWNID